MHTIARMERMIYLLIAYDGTDFHGWQRQPGLRTVQGVLEESLRRVVRHPVELVGSGRTDAGVHAAGQVGGFETTCDLPPEKLGHALSSRIPEDIAILAAREVHPAFHPTSSAVSKLYRYRIHNATARPVEQRTQRLTCHIWDSLDVERMRRASRCFLGEMDFTAMTAAGTVRESMVRTVLHCDVERHLNEVRIDVEGTGFLHKQVRNMVGTLVEVGRGRWEPERVAEILAGGDRRQAGPTMLARGLCLQWVRYPPHLLRCPEESKAAS